MSVYEKGWWVFAIYHALTFVLCTWLGYQDAWSISVLITAFGTAAYVSRRERWTRR
jgi:hypothetical protein